MTQDLEHLKDWIGKTEEVEDRVTQFQIHGLRALFDDPTVPKEGDPCGPMDHWCFFNPRVPRSQIEPVGLLGLAMKTSRVCGVTARAMAIRS